MNDSRVHTPAPGPLPRPASNEKQRARAAAGAEFGRGYLTGFFGGAAALAAILIAVTLLFPPPRTNILLLGLDRRPGDTTYVSRTDTMILASVHAQGNYVGMLSIPRDLYVTLPAGVVGRINTAHFWAEAETPGAGPQAAMQVVRQNFGVAVHHYARIDFVGFVKFVDALGGVTLDVPRPLVDYEYPTYDDGVTTVRFEAGLQHMTGEQALAYARIRHGSSDFQRAERQQLVMAAIGVRLLQPGAWLRLPLVLAAGQQSISTDLTPFDVLRLAPSLLRVGPSGVDRRVIQGNMVESFITEQGGSVQKPVWVNINPLLLEMFGQ